VRFKEILRYAGHNLTSITIFEFKTIKLLYLIGFIKSRHFMALSYNLINSRTDIYGV